MKAGVAAFLVFFMLFILCPVQVWADDYEDDLDAAVSEMGEAMDQLTDALGDDDLSGALENAGDIDYTATDNDDYRKTLQEAGHAADSAIDLAGKSVEMAAEMTKIADGMVSTSNEMVDGIKDIAVETKGFKDFLQLAGTDAKQMLQYSDKITALAEQMENSDTTSILSLAREILSLAGKISSSAGNVADQADEVTKALTEKFIPGIKSVYKDAMKMAEEAGKLNQSVSTGN